MPRMMRYQRSIMVDLALKVESLFLRVLRVMIWRKRNKSGSGNSY